jgi:hypothetical protein
MTTYLCNVSGETGGGGGVETACRRHFAAALLAGWGGERQGPVHWPHHTAHSALQPAARWGHSQTHFGRFVALSFHNSCVILNPFTAKVANNWISNCQADRQSRFLTQSRTKTNSFTYQNCFINLGCLWCKQTHAAHSMPQKHKKIIANQFSRSKVINCLGELLTRLWNAWHSERHCVVTAGGERVKEVLPFQGL